MTTFFKRIALVCAPLWLVVGTATQAQPFVFNAGSERAARDAWRAMNGSPLVERAKGGLVFPVPFTRNADRFYWDCTGTWDASEDTVFEIDYACDRPEAMRSLALYFKSGNGWYIWNRPLPAERRGTLRLLKTDFATEGAPAGWDRIERMRISPWKGQAIDTRLVLGGFRAARNGLLVVRGTTSCPDEQTRRLAGTCADRVKQWLDEAGVRYGEIDDETLVSGLSPGAELLLMPYNPKPSAAALNTIEAFVRKGGRLVVYYGASDRLADVMGFRLGPWEKADRAGQWSAIVFSDPDAWNAPRRVLRNAGGIMPARPRTRGARIIARWASADGTLTRDPAWTVSDAGAWCAQIPSGEDAANERAALIGILGHYDPAVLRQAADRAVTEAGAWHRFPSFDATEAWLLQQAARAPDPEAVRRDMGQARNLLDAMRRDLKAGRHGDALKRRRSFDRSLLAAVAAVQSPARREWRAVWDADGLGLPPGQWDATCRQLAQGGMTAVMPNLLTAGRAGYPSRIFPHAPFVAKYGDPLARYTEAAHAYGLEMHLWVRCWNLEGAPRDMVEDLRKAGRLQVNDRGQTVEWLCPSHPDNVKLMLDAIEEAARAYPLDGVQLDYIRFPDAHACYGSVTRAAFERSLGGRRLASWPDDVLPGGRLRTAFLRWRAGEITIFVRRVRERLKAARPGARLSAAVFGNVAGCRDSIGQDWAGWLEAGLVDFVCPMNYTSDARTFERLTIEQARLPGASGRVFPGIGVHSSQSLLGAAETLEQIALARELGVAGFALYRLDTALLETLVPALNLPSATKP